MHSSGVDFYILKKKEKRLAANGRIKFLIEKALSVKHTVLAVKISTVWHSFICTCGW